MTEPRETRAIKGITKVQELAYEMKVGQAMCRDVVSIAPDAPIADLRDLMRTRRISGVPVVEDGRLVGLFTIEDFIHCLQTGESEGPVSRKMTRDVQALYQDEPLVSAVEKFERMGFGRFPVLDRATGKLVGILTKGDIVEGLLQRLEIEYREEEIHKYRASHIFEDIVADRASLTFDYSVWGRDFARAGGASSGLKKTLSRLGISPDLIRRISIATYEAEMNMVIYADQGTITAEVTPARIRVIAVDRGPGIPDVNVAMQAGYSTASDWVREMGFGAGMGLPNIKNCTDRMEIRSTVNAGTTVEFSVDIPSLAGGPKEAP